MPRPSDGSRERPGDAAAAEVGPRKRILAAIGASGQDLQRPPPAPGSRSDADRGGASTASGVGSSEAQQQLGPQPGRDAVAIELLIAACLDLEAQLEGIEAGADVEQPRRVWPNIAANWTWSELHG